MLRMEIALLLITAFVAYVYFSAQKQYAPLHKTFSVLLAVMMLHLMLDGITVYTVNHPETVPTLLNNILHRFFIGTMIFAVFLFYQYIAILVEEETGKPRKTCKNDTLPYKIILFLTAAQCYNDTAV